MYRWLIVGLLWTVCVLNYADRQAVFSTFTLLEREFGFTKSNLGLIGSAFMIVYALSSPLAGMTGDLFRRKWIVILGLMTWSLFTMFTRFCGGLWGFVLVRGIEGLGESFYFPASTSLISDYHAPDTRSRALSFHHTGTYVGTILGGLVTGWLAERYGWRLPFFTFGALGLALAFVLTVFVREPLVRPREPRAPFTTVFREMARDRRCSLLVVVFVLANFVSLPFYAWLPTLLAEKFGLSVGEAAFAGTFYVQSSSAVGSALGGWIADRWRAVSAAGRVFTQVLGISLYAPFMFWMGWTPNLKTCVVAMCLLGLFKGLYDANVWAAFYDVVPTNRRASLCGLANTLAWAGGALSVYLVGFVVQRDSLNMSQTLQALPALNLVMAILLILVGRRIQQAQASEFSDRAYA